MRTNESELGVPEPKPTSQDNALPGQTAILKAQVTLPDGRENADCPSPRCCGTTVRASERRFPSLVKRYPIKQRLAVIVEKIAISPIGPEIGF